MKLQNIIKIIVLIIGIIALFFLIRIMMLGDDAIAQSSENQGIVSSYIYLAGVVLILATIVTVLFSIKGLFSDGSKLKKALLFLGIFAAIIAVAFILSSGSEQALEDGKVLTATESRWIGAGIRTFYILVVGAVGAMLFTGIKKMIK